MPSFGLMYRTLLPPPHTIMCFATLCLSTCIPSHPAYCGSNMRMFLGCGRFSAYYMLIKENHDIFFQIFLLGNWRACFLVLPHSSSQAFNFIISISFASIIAYDVGVFSKVEVYFSINLHLYYFSGCVIFSWCTFINNSWVNIVFSNGHAFCFWPLHNVSSVPTTHTNFKCPRL